MKKIIFLRPAQYSDKLPDKDVISSFDSLGLQIADPGIDSDSNLKEKIDFLIEKFDPVKMYTSPAIRCIETAKLFNLPFEISNFLNEFKFSLSGTLPNNLLDPENLDVNKLRKELVKAFVDNKTEEKPEEVIIRINNFFELIKNIDGNIICVSHAFIMKFYEIFFRNNEQIKNSKKFLSEYNWEIKPYEFLDGFCVHIDNTGDIHKIELLKNT